MQFSRSFALAVVAAGSLVVTACAPSAPSAPAGGPAAPAATKGIAKAPAGTLLRKIQDRGKIIAGVKYDVPTFGYLNPVTNKLEGFDVDMVKGIANYIFGDPEAVEWKQAVSKDRLPFLKEGVTDIIASTMTITEDRTKEIDFADTYYAAGQALLVPANSTITGIKDLGGKKVATAKGSTSEENIRKKAPTAEVILFDTYSEAVQAMDTNRADAVTTDDIILYGYVKQTPNKYKVVGGQFTVEPYGIGVAKGNPELLAAVNEAVRKMIAGGDWAKIYEKNLPGSKAPSPPPADWRKVTLPPGA